MVRFQKLQICFTPAKTPLYWLVGRREYKISDMDKENLTTKNTDEDMKSLSSGWPSGLRRQTQGQTPCFNERSCSILVFNEGVGSNPTPDTSIRKSL